LSESEEEKSTNVIITPAVYLRYIHSLRDNYVQQSSQIEERKNKLEKLLQKLETISTQVKFICKVQAVLEITILFVSEQLR